MSTTFRSALSIILNLSLVAGAFAQSHSPVSTPVRNAAEEEASLRSLTAQYGRALVAGDVEALRKFWNPQSPNLSEKLRSYKNTFAYARLDFADAQVTKLEITGEKGDRAVSQLTVDERRFDKKTDAVLLTFDPLRGACRSFEWIRTSAGWQIEREFLVQDELAVRLEAASSDQQRDQILEKEKRFVNTTLLGSLGSKALRHSTRADYDTALHYAHLQQVVAERLGNQTGIAASWMNTAIVRHAQDEHEIALQAALKALAMYEGLGSKPGIALAQENLSNIYRAIGDHRRAFQFAQKITAPRGRTEPPQSDDVRVVGARDHLLTAKQRRAGAGPPGTRVRAGTGAERHAVDGDVATRHRSAIRKVRRLPARTRNLRTASQTDRIIRRQGRRRDDPRSDRQDPRRTR